MREVRFETIASKGSPRHLKHANGLFNIAALGVVTQSPAPEPRNQYARRHRFWRESWLLRRKENRRTRRKTLGVRLRSTNHSPRTSPGSNPGRSGGRWGWWLLGQSESRKFQGFQRRREDPLRAKIKASHCFFFPDFIETSQWTKVLLAFDVYERR